MATAVLANDRDLAELLRGLVTVTTRTQSCRDGNGPGTNERWDEVVIAPEIVTIKIPCDADSIPVGTIWRVGSIALGAILLGAVLVDGEFYSCTYEIAEAR